MSGVEKRGCLPKIFHGIGRWITDQTTPVPPPPVTTGWIYQEGQVVDLGDEGKIEIPPTYVKRHKGGTVSVSQSGIGWSGEGITLAEDNKTILRTKEQEELEEIPDDNTRETLRNLLRSSN